MALKKIPELDASGLRKFAFSSAALIVILFALLIPWVFGFKLPVWPWVVAAVLAIWGAVAPLSLNPVYKGWMRFGLVMNRITTPIILGMVFFLVFAPIALGMRLSGRDRLNVKLDKDADSYRVKSTVQPKNKMERPF